MAEDTEETEFVALTAKELTAVVESQRRTISDLEHSLDDLLHRIDSLPSGAKETLARLEERLERPIRRSIRESW